MAKRSKKKWRYPEYIETDQGNTVVKYIPSAKAIKEHKCPFCEVYTGFYEAHVLLLPTRFPNNRRYSHIYCYEKRVKEDDRIVLHPNLTYLSLNYEGNIPEITGS